MSSTRHSQRLVIEGFVAGGDAARYPATRSAFAAAVDQEHPNDAYLLWESCRTELGDWTAQQLLSLIRSCSWDSNVALSCLPHLIERAGDSPGLADELDEVADAVWELYFPIGESADLAMELGRLLLASGRAERALLFLSRSVELHGPTAAACYHLALAHRLLGDTAAARHHAVRALQLDPQQRDALALIAELS